jgi:peptide/nickel transport system ATP-binding protein/peptide/nickel transport system permease protein
MTRARAAPRRRGVLAAMSRLPAGRIGAIGALALLALAVLGQPLFGSSAAEVDVFAQSESWSAAHPFGTDQLGRDILSRTLVATRTSLALAGLAGLIGVVGGAAVGGLAAFVRGPGRRLMMRAIDLLLAFPAVLIAIFVSSIAGPGGGKAAVAIGVALIPQFARLCAGLLLTETGADHVLAARAAGLRESTILRRYTLPPVAGPLAQIAVSYFAISLVAVSSLSFLGLGVQPPDVDWGRMLSEGLQNVYVAPLAVVPPGLAIVVSGAVLALLGDALARGFDPRLWVEARHGGDAPLPDAGSAAPARPRPADARVSVEGLRVWFPGRDGTTYGVRDVSLTIGRGELVGIVGESGSGKSLTVSAIAGIVPAPGVVEARRLDVLDIDVASVPASAARRALSARIAMIFQDPATSLNPVLTIGYQLTETLRLQAGVDRRRARSVAAARLAEVGIADPERVLAARSHELSGGMRQRVMLAMGLAIEPELLLADEPTTALDLTTQAQIIRLLVQINRTRGVPIVLISHDLSLVASVCDRVLVMYGGRVMEELPTSALPDGAMHPYTRALLAAEPRVDLGRLPEGIPGDPPDPAHGLAPGCPFWERCPLAEDRCRVEPPPRVELTPTRAFSCWATAPSPIENVEAR